MKKRTLLVYGATGKAGSLVVENALQNGWAVSAFVRNPQKISEATRSKVNVIQGDLSDAPAVAQAVRSCQPHAIIDASSALPFGHAKGQPANNANRGVITHATIEALEADGRLADCVYLIVGGQLVAEPGGKINKASVAALSWVLRNIVVRKGWREMEEVLRWTFQDTPHAFRFVYARMGQMVVAPSQGKLLPEPTLNNIQHGTASYIDVAEAFVQLAGDETRRWERKAIFFNYANRQ
jgi:putative NADH-flavin reductase